VKIMAEKNLEPEERRPVDPVTGAAGTGTLGATSHSQDEHSTESSDEKKMRRTAGKSEVTEPDVHPNALGIVEPMTSRPPDKVNQSQDKQDKD
jgi:hypothetical protein